LAATLLGVVSIGLEADPSATVIFAATAYLGFSARLCLWLDI
jgi:hypothetical protein